MKRNLFPSILIFSMILLVGIGCSKDECGSSDWAGTYTLVSTDCDDPGVSFDQTIVIVAGTTEGTVIVAGTEANHDGCNITQQDPFFGSTITMDLDGNKLTTTAFGCTGHYEK